VSNVVESVSTSSDDSLVGDWYLNPDFGRLVCRLYRYVELNNIKGA
jgi:hypothetical protein